MELMEGLTLLSTSVQNNAPVFWFLTALSSIILVACIVLMYFCIMDREFGGVIAFIILAVIAFVLVNVCISEAIKPSRTLYKVTIDESVSMVEFYERYEILDQDGLIFTITEKEVVK
jgi:hypothetical protein